MNDAWMNGWYIDDRMMIDELWVSGEYIMDDR
jgi:hypothetical protein